MVLLAIWDHTVLPATRHKWTHPALAVLQKKCLNSELVNGKCPPRNFQPLHRLWSESNSRYQLRSSQSNEVIVPPVKLSTYGPRSFAVAGSTVWNNLPVYLRDPELLLDDFRRQLKTFLFAQYWRWHPSAVETVVPVRFIIYIIYILQTPKPQNLQPSMIGSLSNSWSAWYYSFYFLFILLLLLLLLLLLRCHYWCC